MHRSLAPFAAVARFRPAHVLAACLALALVAFSIPATARAAYVFTNASNPLDPTFNQLLGINNAGTISGYYGAGDPAHPNKGYTLTLPSTFTPENFPGSVQTQVVAINTAGSTAGFYVDGAGVNHGFTNIGGTFKTIDQPGTNFNQLLGLNDSGFAAGFYNDAANNSHAYTVSGLLVFSAVPLIPLAATMSQATGINNARQISGDYQIGATTFGFVYDPGTNSFTTLAFAGATLTQALGLNNMGEVVGTYTTVGGMMHGFTWTKAGGFLTVDAPGGIGTTTINGVNDSGQIVGFFLDAKNNTIGFQGTLAPVPEPGSLVLLGLGVLAVGCLRGVRRKA